MNIYWFPSCRLQNKRSEFWDLEEVDLKLLQDFNAAAIAATDHCGYLHPRDIPHHLYNGNLHYDPAEVMTIWEDDLGVAGLDERVTEIPNIRYPTFLNNHNQV